MLFFPEVQYNCKMNYSNEQQVSKKYKTLTVSVPKEFIYMVNINRPQKLNAMDDMMWMYVFILNHN